MLLSRAKLLGLHAKYMAVDQFSFKHLMNYSKFKSFFFQFKLLMFGGIVSVGCLMTSIRGGGAKTLF